VLAVAWEADRRRSILAFLLLGLQALTQSLFAWWLKLLIDGVQMRASSYEVAAAAGIATSIAGSAALSQVGGRVQAELRERAHQLVERRLVELVGTTPTLSIHETPEHLTQLEVLRDHSWQFGQIVPNLVGFFVMGVRVVIATLLLASVSPLLLLLCLFALPTLLISAKAAPLFELGNELAAAPARLANHLFDLATKAGPAKEIRLFRLASELTARYRITYERIRTIHRGVNRKGQVLSVGGRLCFVVGYLAAVVFVVDMAVRGEAPVGDVALTGVLAGQVLGLVNDSALEIQLGLRNLAVGSRYVYLKQISDSEKARGPMGDAPAGIPVKLREGLTLDHVSYRYPSASRDTLTDVNLVLAAGSAVAIVGDNGAGKTTLVKLLAGLYRPTKGGVLVDGIDLACLDPAEWREHVSASFQDHARFELLVREAVGIGNIHLLQGTAQADVDRAVTEALARAGASDVFDSMPGGLSTQLGSSWAGGIDLSGGQWQKLAIGRAMMRKVPLLLLLDEPTAALDAETEHRLFEAWTAAALDLRRQSGAVTVLVSHRFSTVRMADLIVVLQGGRVVEVGTHSELLVRDGVYADLFRLQARSYR
jgi:ATP-binding cassette subfamily B protein